ncbi:MAG: hypothetical protein ABF292_06135, partial [Desulfobacterales bacterium]
NSNIFVSKLWRYRTYLKPELGPGATNHTGHEILAARTQASDCRNSPTGISVFQVDEQIGAGRETWNPIRPFDQAKPILPRWARHSSTPF